MYTGLIFTVHKYPQYCSHGLAVPQVKNAFLLPILAPDMLVEMAAAMYGCSLCVSSMMCLERLERYTRETVPHWYGAAAP
jgi:hypothetical protein